MGQVWRKDAQSRHLNNNDSVAGERVEEVMVVVLFFSLLPRPLSFYKRHDGGSVYYIK